MFQKLGLDSREESMVLTACKGDLSYTEVRAAVRAISLEGRGAPELDEETVLVTRTSTQLDD